MSILKDLKSRGEGCIKNIQEAQSIEQLEQIRTQWLGKQGILTEALKAIREDPAEQRPQTGQQIHSIRDLVKNALHTKKQALLTRDLNDSLHGCSTDVTLPGRGQRSGAIHPLTQVRTQLEAFFKNVGFEIQTGPEIEHEEINFTALNMAQHHPARALHDTFYIKDQPQHLLRTHTSTVQIHALKSSNTFPLRIISTGAVYRRDSDVTHTPMFHQLEGMVVHETANFSELKGLLIEFLKALFDERNITTRFRASYFPFTEPSAEVDIQCVLCHGKHCSFCGHTGWLEILGCGMIHPAVLKNSNIDPDQYQGYAFGIGIERLTLLKHYIPDIRLLFQNDTRLLEQFK